MHMESLEQFASRYKFALVNVHLGIYIRGFSANWLLDGDGFLGEVLGHQVLQWNVSDGGIVSLILERRVRDQRRDVLFDLGEVLHDVVLSKRDAVLVVLSLSYAQVEFRFLEHLDHSANGRLDLSEHLLRLCSVVQAKRKVNQLVTLGFICLHLLSVDLIFEHGHLVLEGLLQVELLFLRESGALINSLDLLFDIDVALFEMVVFGVERIHIVEQRIVLLLCLDERRHDLFDVRNTSGLLDLIECVLDDLHVSQILVHQLSLLLVSLNDFVEATAKNDDGVGKLSLGILFGGLSSFSFLLLFLFVEANCVLVALLQLQLLFGDRSVEITLLFFILGLQSNYLNSSVLCDATNFLLRLVCYFGIFFGLSDVL